MGWRIVERAGPEILFFRICEFSQENEALTPKNTIPWQKFAETAET